MNSNIDFSNSGLEFPDQGQILMQSAESCPPECGWTCTNKNCGWVTNSVDGDAGCGTFACTVDDCHFYGCAECNAPSCVGGESVF